MVVRWCKAQEDKKKYMPAARSYEWLPHDHDCKFCKRFVGRGKSSVGKVQSKKPQRLSQDKENSPIKTKNPSVGSSAMTDHTYSNIPFHTKFLSVRKRKREDEQGSANKKLILSIDETDENLSLGSPFAMDLCLATPLHPRFQCGICHGVLNKPHQTKCEHLFCETCIKPWIVRFSCCGQCDEVMSLRDIRECDTHFNEIISSLPMKCINSACKSSLTVGTYELHVNSCAAVTESDTGIEPENLTDDLNVSNISSISTEEVPSSLDDSINSTESDASHKSKRGRPRHENLVEMRQPAQNSRLRTLKKAIKDHAESNSEDIKSVYYALILNFLRSKKLWKEYNEVKSVMSGVNTMTSAKCLAIRVSSFMSVTKYRRTQQVTNYTANKKVFEPYSSLVREEKQYLPGGMDQASSAGEAIDALHHVPGNFPELGLPNVKSEMYHYKQALEVTIKDLEDEIKKGLECAGEDPNKFTGTMNVYVKDGCDGMGEVKCKQDKTSKAKLPDKALRFSATLLKITMEKNNEEIIIFEEAKPNSQMNCRPLLIALADENDYYSITSLLSCLLHEREQLQETIITVQNRSGHIWNFQPKLYATMYDEKLERKIVGLAGSSSEFLCTMCEMKRSDAFTDPFSCTEVTRTPEQNMANADRFFTNDSDLSYKSLQDEARGIRGDSFVEMTPHIDALHSEINNALWMKKVFVREIAGLTEAWSYRDNVSKGKLQDAEEKLNEALRQGVGLQKHLMQPGNYSRQLLQPKSVEIVLN